MIFSILHPVAYLKTYKVFIYFPKCPNIAPYVVEKSTLCEGNCFYNDTRSDSFPSRLEVGHALYHAWILGGDSGFFPRECETGMHLMNLTLRLIMSYIYIYIYIYIYVCVCVYGAPILDVSRSHTTTHHSR